MRRTSELVGELRGRGKELIVCLRAGGSHWIDLRLRARQLEPNGITAIINNNKQ